jgi:hypothetical protein
VAQSYSAAVNWKILLYASFASHLNRVGIGICIRDELGQFVLLKTE